MPCREGLKKWISKITNGAMKTTFSTIFVAVLVIQIFAEKFNFREKIEFPTSTHVDTQMSLRCTTWPASSTQVYQPHVRANYHFFIKKCLWNG